MCVYRQKDICIYLNEKGERERGSTNNQNS